MTKKPDRIRKARGHYIYDRLTFPAIALKLGVTAITVSRWKSKAKSRDGDDWDAARQAHILSGSGLEPIVSEMAEQMVLSGQALLKAIKEDEANDLVTVEKKVKLIAMLSDSLAKGVASAARAAPKLNEYAVAQDVVKRLADFITKEFPQHGPALIEVLEPFAAELAETLRS